MTYDNEAIVRRAYHTAEGIVLDVAGLTSSFAEEGVFNDIVGQESYRGEQLGDVLLPLEGGLCCLPRHPGVGSNRNRGGFMPEMELADQLQEMADTAVSDQRIDDQDLVRILRFINSVAVVGQAFDDVLATLIELSHVGPDHLQEPRRSELLADLDRVVQISRYKNVEEICSRLHGLSEHYNDVIAPKLGGLTSGSAWGEVFALLNEHEGKIILMVRNRVHMLHSDLAAAKSADLPALRQAAEGARDEIQGMLEKLWKLRTDILGLSGHVGLLELIETGQRPGSAAGTTSGV